MRTLQFFKLKLLKHTEIRTVEDMIENIPPVVLRVRVQQRLNCHSVGEQKDDTQQSEVDQLYHL